MKQVRHSSRLDQGEGVVEDRTRRYHPSPPGRTGLQGHGGSRQQIAQKTPIIRNGRLSLDGLLLFDLPPEGLYRLLGIVRCGSDSAGHAQSAKKRFTLDLGSIRPVEAARSSPIPA